MMDCPNAEIRDLLPDFVHRALSDGDAARVTAHLGSCAACRDELALLRTSAAVLRVRPVVDVAAIVRALPAPPAQAPVAPRLVREDGARPIEGEAGVPEHLAHPRRRAAMRWGVAAAAAAAIALAVNVRDAGSPDPLRGDSTLIVARVPDTAAHAPVTPIAPDSTAESTRAPAPLVAPVPRAPVPTRLAMSMEGGPGDLTDAELERLIGDLESLDGLPNGDPDESADPIGNVEGARE